MGRAATLEYDAGIGEDTPNYQKRFKLTPARGNPHFLGLTSPTSPASESSTKWERDVLQTPMMKLIFEYLCREAEGFKDVSMFLACSSTLSGREFDENGTPVFRTLEAFHVSLVLAGPYILGVLSDTSESSASATSAGLSPIEQWVLESGRNACWEQPQGEGGGRV